MQKQVNFNTVFNRYIDQENLHQTEGRRGLINLCRMARALGYNDFAESGRLNSTACLGDLTLFLEDNPGAIEAVFEWISNSNCKDWAENLDYLVLDNEEEDEEDDEE
jgi:hypothetical protein